MEIKPIPTYIINLKTRKDRKEHFIKEFIDHPEFELKIITADEHKIGVISLWKTIKYILRNIVRDQDEFIILCEDDHQFTREYTKERLFNYIEAAKEKDADILLGGVSGFTNAIQISVNLFWVEKFSGLQFTVIFQKFFKTILEVDFGVGDAVDYKVSSLSHNKFFIYPFISVQKDFGYSDVTPGNNVKGHVEEVFKRSNEKIRLLQNVIAHYKRIRLDFAGSIDPTGWDSITIPTYVINLMERTDRRKHIENQFQKRSEFDVRIVKACKHKIGTVGLWLSIRKIIETALKNDDDVIIICEDDHEFTLYYRKEILIKNIFKAHTLGCNILTGGVGGFDSALPITENLWWVNSFWCTQFIVVFKKFFGDILQEPFNDTDTADGKLSEMTSQKMVVYPFISVQKDFGYSDVTRKNHEKGGLISKYFEDTDKRLKILQEV